MNTSVTDIHDRGALDAEQAVAGALLQDARLADEIADIVGPEDFAHHRHVLIVEAVQAIAARGEAVDAISVIDELRSAGNLDAAGDAAYVASLARDVVTANAKTYAARVAKAAAERRLRAAGQRIGQLAANRERPLEERLADAAQALDAVTPQRGGGGPRLLRDVLPEWLEDLERRHEAGGEISGLATGFVDLDRMLSGLHPGDLVVLAARPSMGKTALALNIAEQVSVHKQQHAAFFSLEMPGAALVERAAASLARIDAQRLRVGDLDHDEWGALTEAMKRLQAAPLHVDDASALHVDELCRRARRLHRQHGLALVVIDYLQLLRADQAQRKDLEIGQISAALKRLAKDLKVPVLALSQLNRKLEERPNKRPIPADLRESGAIEQDADVIAFIYRDEVYHDDSPAAGTAEIIIGKQRNGPVGKVRLTFQPRYQRFENFIGPEPEPTRPPKFRGGFNYED